MSFLNQIPNNFFVILSSKNRMIYFSALMVLHEMFEESISIQVEDYLSVLISKIEDYEIYYEDDDDKWMPITNPAQKARFILNKFIKTGWIDKDYKDGTFIEVIELKNYSIKILKLLYELENTKVQEYNSLVFSTYSSLKQAYSEDQERMYDALIAAKENTSRLIYALKGLYHGIRDFHKQISELNNVNELLKEHFEDYKSLIDKIYHPIKTMDSIHRYMQPIQSILLQLITDNTVLESMYNRAKIVRLYENNEEARIEIINDIDYITRSYNSIGGIVDEIDRKHSAYTRNSIEKIRYLITADRSVKGKIVDVLRAYSDENFNGENNILLMLNREIIINRQENIDSGSLYHKSIRYRKNLGEPIKLDDNTYRFDDDSIKDIIKKMKSKVSVYQIHAFIKEWLNNKNEIELRDIEIKSENEFVLAILAVIRANDQNSFYRIMNMNEEISKNGYILSNIKFIRKGR